MGGSPSTPAQSNKQQQPKQTKESHTIKDKYFTVEEIQTAMRTAGIESSNLIVGIDFTKSNTWTGKNSFAGQCLHQTHPETPIYNPYQRVIDSIGRTLEVYDDDRFIPTYGFGDVTTTNKSVFSFLPNDQPCAGVNGVLQQYNTIIPSVQLSGPTNFAPLIRKAIDIVRNTKQYHILLIIADGQVDNVKDTTSAIIEASNYPLSIVCVGVGDGPFDLMEHFDDNLTANKFDNFQFVNFEYVIKSVNNDAEFAVRALQEVPDQYKCIKKLGYLDN